jgi:hypothetical protein
MNQIQFQKYIIPIGVFIIILANSHVHSIQENYFIIFHTIIVTTIIIYLICQ